MLFLFLPPLSILLSLVGESDHISSFHLSSQPSGPISEVLPSSDAPVQACPAFPCPKPTLDLVHSQTTSLPLLLSTLSAHWSLFSSFPSASGTSPCAHQNIDLMGCRLASIIRPPLFETFPPPPPPPYKHRNNLFSSSLVLLSVFFRLELED